MKFAIRNFRDFEEWVEFDGSRISLLYGPNSTGKSSLLAAFLLLREQRDLFRLSFSGGAHGIPAFLEAVRERDAERRIDIVLRSSVDAAGLLFPLGVVRPEPVAYDFEIGLSYAADPFDGGQSGILMDCSIFLLRPDEKVLLFSIVSDRAGYEFHFCLEEVLRLPFVHERVVGADADAPDHIAAADRAINLVQGLVRSSRGEPAHRAKALLDSLKSARDELSLGREFERIVLPQPSADPFRPLKPKTHEHACRVLAAERKYLRSLADVFVAESLAENGLRSMHSRESGKEIRLSFYSVFYEILASAGFLPNSAPPFLARFPARFPPRDRTASEGGIEAATAIGARTYARRAEENYAALVRDAVNYSACRRADGSASIEGARLSKGYGASIIAYRESHQASPLISEGGFLDPGILDLEGRRDALRSFLSKAGIAEDIEFLPQASEERALCLVQSGRRDALGDKGEGIRRLVLLASCLLYLPWGSQVVVEDPENGLDPARQALFADLLRLLVKKTGAEIVVETRSPEFVTALGPYRAESASSKAEKKAKKNEAQPPSPPFLIRSSEDGATKVIQLRASRPAVE